MKRGALSREIVLEKALEIAMKEGLSQLTYNGLAREIGVVPQSLYRYVTNLDDVRSSIIARYVRQLLVYLAEETRELTGKEAVIRFGTGFLEFAKNTISFSDMAWGFATYANNPLVELAIFDLRSLGSDLISNITDNKVKENTMFLIEYIIGHLGMISFHQGKTEDLFGENLARLVEFMLCESGKTDKS
mgnify:CR=1 FL=1